MTCKFVKCIIREKLLVDNNELIKAVAETFSIEISFVFSLNTLYHMPWKLQGLFCTPAVVHKLFWLCYECNCMNGVRNMFVMLS